jgi:hypothetical protein
MLRNTTVDWSGVLLNGMLVGALIFLSALPALGWAWHRVLPEHTHVFIGERHSHVDEVLPANALPDEEQSACPNCTDTQISAGIVHSPSNAGLQVLGIAALGLTLSVCPPPGFSEHVILPIILFQSPPLLLLDPPPNAST